jgi:TonB-dependent starch-binding outer membrane protein SusC
MRTFLVRCAAWVLVALPLILFQPAADVAAQETGTITGTVTDARTMRPIAGASARLSGTQRGAMADAQGRFTIPNVTPGTYTVRITMIGYRGVDPEVTVTAGATANITVELTPAALQLDQIVVTGQAGATERRAIGNTVSSIQAEQINELAPATNVRQMMSARAPGLTYLSDSGQAGAGGRIRIRGANSFQTGNLSPVVYVDGIRIHASNTIGGSSLVQPESTLDAINPEDIESIEIIKGPAASTLYGAEAAAGVIQIFTKRGREADQVQWTFNVERGQTAWKMPIPDNYFTCTQARINNPSTFPGCQGQAAGAILVGNPIEEERPVTLRTGDAHKANLSARGGGSGYSYYISFEESKEQGVYNNNFFNRRGGRANFTVTPSQNFNFQANVGVSRTHNKMNWANNSSNSILRNGLRGRPGAMGTFAVDWRGMTPELANMYDEQRWSERHTVGTQINWSPFSWLDNRLSLGLDKNDRTVQIFYEIDQTGTAPFGAVNATGTVWRSLPMYHIYTVDYAGTARYRVNDDLLSNTSFGFQLNRTEFESHTAYGEGLVANTLNLVSHAAVTTGGQSRSEQVSAGFFVQEQLIWRDRLYGTVAVRVDDNSAFGEDFSFVTYPKAQLAWVMSDEAFFDFPWVDEFRVRAAWGRAGSAPSPFSADRTFGPQVTTVGDESVGQLAAQSFGNPNLKAETGQEFELGFDGSLLDGRMGVELTYYHQSTKDALLLVPVPQSSGWTGNHLRNVGEIRNSGIEILLTGTPVYTRDIQWEVATSIATNKNELVSFGDAPLTEIAFGSFASVQRHREGFPLGGYWGVDVVRDAQGNPVLDANGNVTVDTENEIYVGPMLPTREIGFSNTVTLFGNVQLYSHFDYKGGNTVWCAICSVRSRLDDNHWEVNDPNAPPEQRAVWTSLQTLSHLHDADFIKLRELSVTYSLPREWAQSFRASRASVNLAARDLWMWTKYKPYVQRDGKRVKADPEVSFWGTQTFTTLDYGSTPMTRRINASIRVVF